MNRNHFLKASSFAFLYSSHLAFADSPKPFFRSAVTLNPHFEKRDEMGEDAYVLRDRFICVTDGVGGWIRKLVKTGNFTKEFVRHIG